MPIFDRKMKIGILAGSKLHEYDGLIGHCRCRKPHMTTPGQELHGIESIVLPPAAMVVVEIDK